MAASKAGVTPDEVNRVERTNPLADHILDALSTIGLGVAAETPSGISYDPSPLSHKSAPQRKHVREALSELGAARDVVIGTYAAGMQLAGVEGPLLVFVTCSPAAAAQRIAGAVRATSDRRFGNAPGDG